uniref:Uncharacterized protein n=1 Tax=Meloidogyne incognita TaxID=6306 RepID=A0A914MTX8_MELIC
MAEPRAFVQFAALFHLFILFCFLNLLLIESQCSAERKAFFRRNSRHLRRLSRLYDWEVDEFGSFRPVIPITQNQRFLRQIKGENEEKLEIKINNQQQQQICANDSYILDKLLINYNRHKIPGGKVEVMVEVWVQEITTISDITSDFQAS